MTMEAMSLNRIDFLIVIITTGLILLVGMWSGRRQGASSDEYFLANRKMPWWLVGVSFVATGISSEQMVGTVGMAYLYGMGIANWEWFLLPMYIMPLVFFIPLYLKNKIGTVPEFLSKRFGPLCGTIFSVILVLVYTFVFMVTVLYSGSLAISEMLQVDFYIVLWSITIIVGLYTIRGGLKAVMWTDAVQAFLLILGGSLLFFSALRQIDGGWDAMIEAVPERMHLYQPADHPIAPFFGMMVATFGIFTFYQVGNQSMIQRMLSARSTWDGLMGMVSAAFINLFRPFVGCFLGLVVFHWIHVMHKAAPLENQDLAFSFALKALSPDWGLRGIVLAGFAAAIMSTLSSLVNSVGTIFSRDLYVKHINKNASDKSMVGVGRLAAFSSLLMASLLAPIPESFGGIFQYFQSSLNYFACPFMATVLVGIFWKRTNYFAGVFGLVGGFVIQIIIAWLFSGNIPPLPELHFFYVGGIAQVITMIGIIVITFLTSKYQSIGRDLVWSADLIKELHDTNRPWYQRITFWFSIFAILNITVYIIFW